MLGGPTPASNAPLRSSTSLSSGTVSPVRSGPPQPAGSTQKTVPGAAKNKPAAKPSALPRPAGIPKDWVARPTRGPGGTQYYNPKNPNENVRVMPGNPNSPYPNSQAPYARQQNSAGTYLREDGTPSPMPRGGLRDPDAHIPLSKFKFR
jgi:hypothetical protein